MRLWQATRKLRTEGYERDMMFIGASQWGLKLGCFVSDYQFFFPRMKKELPSGIGTIFSLGPENSGFNGATPEKKRKEVYILI